MKYYPVPDALKKVALFQKNSYWVFRNDTTGAIDCTFVKSDPLSSSTTDQLNDLVEYIKIPLQSNLFNEFYLYARYINWYDAGGSPFLADVTGFNFCCPGKTAFVLFDDTLTNHHGIQRCRCNMASEVDPFDGDKFMELGEYFDFKVNNLSFDTVNETRAIFSPIFYQKSDTLDSFFSPGKGLVKIVFRVDTSNNSISKRSTMSWSLIRYNVIR